MIVQSATEKAGAIIAAAEDRAKRVEAETNRRREQELQNARTAGELLTTARAQAADEARALRSEAEQELRVYVEPRQRGIDRLIEAACREGWHVSGESNR